MMKLLQMNKDRINEQEKVVLDQLELRYRDCMVSFCCRCGVVFIIEK